MFALSRKRAWLRTGLAVAVPLFVILMVSWFADHAIRRGLSLRDAQEIAASRLYHGDAMLATVMIYGHMIAGGALTVLAPLQLIGPLRRVAPKIHHFTGYAVAVLCLATALGGLAYIATQGTVGGPVMSVGFAIYGLLMGVAAVRTVQLARRRDPRHRAWALRLIVLALGSFLYRVHYGLWYLATDGLFSNDAFTGGFDIAQNFAFYVPYLIGLEILLRRRAHGSGAVPG